MFIIINQFVEHFMNSRAIGAFEAKTHFSQILVDIEKGNEVIITKRGKPIALLSPIKKDANVDKVQLAIEAINNLRKNIRLNSKDEKLTIQSMKEEGRK